MQALVTWLRFRPFMEKFAVEMMLISEPLYVKVSVANLLWGQHSSLWKKMQKYYPSFIPNDTWFGLMYQVNFFSICGRLKISIHIACQQ